MNQINVVPYIDVMLVLLVIFMVTAQAEAIFIEVKADGALALRPSTSGNARAIRKDQLGIALQDALAKNPEQAFLVAADSKLDYQKVIDVLEVARGAGVRKISLVTQSATTQK